MFRARSRLGAFRFAVLGTALAPLLLAGCDDDLNSGEIITIVAIAADVVLQILYLVL